MRKTTYSSVTKEMCDFTTGEVAQIETMKRQKNSIDDEEFYMTFINMVAPLFELKNGTAKAVLEWMCRNAEFNSGKIIFSADERLRICEDLKISKYTLSMSLKILQEKKLIAGVRGTYRVNPQIF